MLAIAGSRSSPSDTWKYKDAETKKKSMLESWRVRAGSRESREKEASGETKERSGDWTFWTQYKAKKVDEIGVYGDCIPPEWRLQKMYKQLKIDNNKFTTWLVESVYPRSESLPSYITLSRKQAKGMSKPDWGRTSNAILTTSADHSKYDIIVNNLTELARQIEKVTPTILALLDHLIIERIEYSHWMSRKSTDQLSQFSDESHIYYIKVLKEVQTILAERMEPETNALRVLSPSSPNLAKAADASAQTHNTTLGKRKISSINAQGLDQRKAVKSKSTTTKPKRVLQKEVKHSTDVQKQKQEEWRQVIADSCTKTADKECAPVAKPMSYAAALCVAIVA